MSPDQSGNTSRRGFLHAMSLAGAALSAPLRWAPGASPETRPGARIENRFFAVQYDAVSGRLGIMRADGTVLVEGAVARVLTRAGARCTADAAYVRTVETGEAGTLSGTEKLLRANCADGTGRLDVTVQATLHDDQNTVVLEVICRNVSPSEPVHVEAVELLRASPDTKGFCNWPGTTRILTNGRMYYDPGRVAESVPGEALESWWNVGFFAGEKRPGLAAGYLENNHALGHVTLIPGPSGDGTFSLVAASKYQKGFVLAPGAAISSDRFIFCVSADPFSALEEYAQRMADAHDIRLKPAANGWCSWSYAYEGISEQEMLRIAEYAAGALKPYGMEYIQVDDGYYRAFGDWEGNGKFPHGMKWLAGRIRDLGLKPGIWLAPYVISEGTDVHVNHPEWLVRKANGELRAVRPGSESEDDGDTGGRRRYALDISHPEAAQWLGRLFDTAANDWGYDFIKVDFVDWSLLAADRYHDPSATRASLYRKGAEIMRRAMGPDRHLLDCGPGQLSAGFLDSMRIELDQPPVNWNQYFLKSASTAPAAAKRYYFHRRVWMNDADHIVLAPLTVPQAQAAATLIAMSGGTTFSGDRLSDLDAVRLDILRKVLPAYGAAARPLDLWEHDRHELFALSVKKPFAQWTVLAAFNADMEAPARKTVALERLGLDPAKTHLAHNFWEQRLHGEVQNEIVLDLPPSSVALLAIHEARDTPQFLSTDRHVLQGAVELEDMVWDGASGVLSGVSLGSAGTEHRVFVRLPQAHEWVQDTPFFFHDGDGFSFKMMDGRTLRVHARFGASGRVAWRVNLRELFPGRY